MKKIFLASSSPRRKELLKMCGFDFTSEPADIDETIHLENDLEKEITNLAERKAQKILTLHPEAVVIGSDTIVTIDGIVMGKPHSFAQACEMLERLNGRTHEVITGLAVLSSERRYKDVSLNKVTFGSMSRSEIEEYVKSGEPMDKAGAYGIQGLGARYIIGIEGDFYAVMGLPVRKVYTELKHYLY